jgi:hypothetical protein
MSDIGLNITVLDIFVYGVIAALPLTTTLLLILVVARLGIGHAAARRGLHGPERRNHRCGTVLGDWSRPDGLAVD